MTPAEAKNLRAMKGKYVQVTFRDPNDDWPYFRLLEISRKDGTIKLKGMDFPRSLGGHKHAGDEFWTDWRDVASIKPVMERI